MPHIGVIVGVGDVPKVTDTVENLGWIIEVHLEDFPVGSNEPEATTV